MLRSGEKESTSVSDLWLQGSSRASHPLQPDKHLTSLSEACQRDGESKAMLARRCRPQHRSALLALTQTPAAKLRVAEFLSKGNSLREGVLQTESSAIHVCIYMCMCTCTYVPVGDAVQDAVPLVNSWTVAAVRAWVLLPGERKLPAFSAGLTFTKDCPWKRLGSIRIVNLIISRSLNGVMIEQDYRNIFPLVKIPVPQGQLKLQRFIFYVSCLTVREYWKENQLCFRPTSFLLYSFLL